MKKAVTYSIAVLAMSYAIAGILYLAGVLNESTRFVVSMGYMLLPLAAAAICDRAIYKNNLITSWGLKFRFNRWLFAPLIFIPVLIVLTTAVNALMPGFRLEFNHIEASKNIMTPEQFEAARPQLESLPSALFYLSQVVSAVIAGYTINALFAFGEEAGWRGHLLCALKGRPFWQASLFIGAVWGIWHAPLILLGHNYPGHPRIGVAMMTLFCLLLTPAHMYIRIKAQSVYAASFLHGFLNALAALPALLIVGGDDLTKGVTGVPGVIALVILNMALFAFDTHVTKDKIMLSALN